MASTCPLVQQHLQQQQQPHSDNLTGPGLNNSLYPSQDSNLSVGSAHSNDGMAAGNGGNGGAGIDKPLGAPPDPSPEKMPHAVPTARTPKERKRKRKNDTQQQQQLQGQEQQQNATNAAAGGGAGSAEKGVKKIN